MEVNNRVCKICRVSKLRIQRGSFNYKDKRWADETGRLWNGNVCPSCVVEKSRHNMQKSRKNKEA